MFCTFFIDYYVYYKSEGSIGFIVISNSRNKIITAYPFIKCSSPIPKSINRIIEWQHVNGVEAQIQGKGKKTFSVTYFSIDYYKNESFYKKNNIFDAFYAG